MDKKVEKKVYRQGQCIQSMVQIKYNKMKISKNPIPSQQQSMRRKLRSASKNSPKDCPGTGTSSDEKAIEQIQKQYDNQQSINHSKSTALIQEDSKLGVFESLPFFMRTRRTRYADLPKPKQQDLPQEIVTKDLLEEVAPLVVTPVVEQILPQPELPRLQPEEFVTPVKQQARNLKADQNPVFKQSRRSGRKHKRTTVTQVPFRKFQDSFEQKIVVLINRIHQRKSNEKDFEIFIEKLQKISPKELYNPYVISGVQTVLKLIQRPNLSQSNYLSRFSHEVKRLSVRIWQELGKIDDYEDAQIEKKEIDFEGIKPKFIKKVYRMLVESKKFGLKEARQRSFEVSESFFANYDNYSRQEDFLSFFRDQKYLTC